MLIIPVLSVALAAVLYFGSRSMIADTAKRDPVPAPQHSLAS
jgi:hypothetical protein